MPTGNADVASGELLWIQGYDGNPPMEGFAVFGTLRLQSVDDAQPVGINLSSGAITNTPLGRVLVSRGAGGARFINGSVFNDGEFQAGVGMTFGGESARFRNTGSVTGAEGAKIEFRGQNNRLELAAGEFNAPGGVVVRDGTVTYDGGIFTGDITLFRSQIRVAPTVLNALEVDFGGVGCRYDGAITPDRTLTIWGGDDGTAGTLTLSGHITSRGTVALSSRGGGMESWLILPSGVWTNAAGGRFQTLLGAGGLRRVFGNLKNEGEWTCTAGVLFSSQTGPVVNSGSVNLNFSATINSAAGYRQLAGSTVLLGGAIYCPTNDVVISAGTLEGGGRVYGRLLNNSRIIEKQWQGQLRVEGDFEQGSDAYLGITLNAGSTNAILYATNTAKIRGGLAEISHVNAAAIRAGDTFILLKAQAIEGWFDEIRLPAQPAGIYWQIERKREENGEVGEIRLLAASEPQPPSISTDRFREEGILEVFGGIAPGLRVEFSSDLVNWTTIANPRPFPAYLKLEGLTPLPSSQIGFFRTILEE